MACGCRKGRSNSTPSVDSAGNVVPPRGTRRSRVAFVVMTSRGELEFATLREARIAADAEGAEVEARRVRIDPDPKEI